MNNTPQPDDFTAIKQRQQATWGAGDYGVIGITLQIVGEHLCDTLDVRPGERVLDVAAGNGNVTLAAARHWCDVTSTDYVGALLDQTRRRAEAEGRAVTLREADAENLPFADDNFDVVVSSFGVMFAPNQEQAARELVRVCRPGGRIGLASWTPQGFGGALFGTIARAVPPPIGVRAPTLWGSEHRLAELFAGHRVRSRRRHFDFRYKSAEHWLDIQLTYFGPTMRAFAALGVDQQRILEAELLALANQWNRCTEGALIMPAEYLEAVIVKR